MFFNESGLRDKWFWGIEKKGGARFFRILTVLFLFFWPTACAAAQPVVNAVFPDSTFLFYQGRDEGVRAGDVFEILRDDFVIGRAVVTKVEKLHSFARMTAFTMPVRRGDALRKVGPAMPLPEAEPLRSVIMFSEEEGPKRWPEVSGEPEKREMEKEMEVEKPAPGVIIEEKTRERLEEAKRELQLKFDGYHYIKYRTYGSSGATGTFISDSGLLFHGQALEQGTNLEIEATFREKFKLGGYVYQMPLQERELLFTFEAGHISAMMGDFASEFPTGELSPFSKKVSGGEVLYSTKKLDVSGLFSESKSYQKTQSFSGNGTYGPYRIDAIEILPGSETVQVNGETVPADEYQIDYFVGKVTFCSEDMPPECRVISESDRVQITYEQRLLMALRGEGVTGVGAAYRPDMKLLNEVGFSYLNEEALMSEQQVKVEGTYSITLAELNAQTAGTDRMPADATPSQTIVLPIPENSPIEASGYLLLDFGFENVKVGDTVLRSGTDYVIKIPDDYARGIIRLLAPASDTVSVQYVYYAHDFVNVEDNEEISEVGDLEGSVFRLSKYTIYSGTEIVRECVDDGNDCRNVGSASCDPISTQYTVSESENEIVFTGDVSSVLVNKRICIAYYYVPSAPPRASQFDHSIMDVTTSWDFGPLLSVDYEYARSEADVSKTPIQVVRERVTTFGQSVTCPSNDYPELCTYKLRNDNIIDGTERISVSTSDAVFTSGSEYFVEIDTGNLRFASAAFATGTVVYADYQYNPPADVGVKTGSAYSLDAMGSYRMLDYTYKKRQMDTVFSPLGGNTTLETDRTETTLGLRPTEGVSISYQKTDFTRAQDIDEINFTETSSSRYALQYSKGWLTSLSYSMSKEDSEDNRDPHVTGYSRDGRDLLIGAKAPLVDGLSVSFASGKKDYSDKTGESNNSNSNTTTYGFSYEPEGSGKYSIDTQFSRNTMNYFGLTSYSVTNKSRYIGFDIIPIPLITVAAEINSQRVSDSRPESVASGLDSTAVSLSSRPFWRVSSLLVTLNQEDYPTQGAGSTRIKSSNCTFTLDVASGFKVSPTFTRNVSQVTGASTTSNNTRSLRFEYRPSGRPYDVYYLVQRGKESSGTSGSTSRKSDFELKYEFSEKFDTTLKLGNNRRSSSGGQGNSDETLTLFLNYLPKEDWTLTTKWERNQSRSTGSQIKRRNLYLTSQMQVSKILTWNLDYQLRNFRSTTRSGSNFVGSILETELRADF